MSISVITLLIKRQFKESFKIYGIGLLVLLALLLFLFLIVHQWQDSFSGAVQNGVFVIGLFLGGGVFSNAMFHEFSSPQSGMWLLSIPAKHSEKVVSNIIMSTLFFLLVYIVLFYIADILYLMLISSQDLQAILNPFKDNFYQFFFLYLLFNGFILLGSVVFNTHSFIKTLLTGVLFLILFNYINTTILEFLIPETTLISSVAFDSFLFSHQGENIKVLLTEKADVPSWVFVNVVLPISIWFAVWLKLKEKEI